MREPKHHGALTTESLKAGLTRIAAAMEEAADELNTADGKLGDGDLGVTMVRGCRLVMEALPDLPEDVGMALMKCAQAFTKTSGSSYGTLLATGLMSAAKAAKGRTEVPWSEAGALLGGALEAMMLRGKASLGDKTVLDAIEAARAEVGRAGRSGGDRCGGRHRRRRPGLGPLSATSPTRSAAPESSATRASAWTIRACWPSSGWWRR